MTAGLKHYLRQCVVNLKDISGEKLFNTPFAGLVVVDGEGEIVRCNGRMLALTGFDHADLEGGCLQDFVHPDHRSELYSACRHMEGQTRNISDAVMKFRKKDNGYLECIFSLFSINDESGAIAGHVLNFTPYTGEALTRSYVNEEGVEKWIPIQDKDKKEEFLCNVFHGVLDAILIMDSEGNILSYNMKILEILGLNYDQISKVGNFKNISADDMNIKAAKKYLKEAFAGTDQFFTWQIKRPHDSSLVDVEIYLTVIDKMGEKAILATIRDITDKKRMEDTLKSSEYRYRQLVDNSPNGIVIHRDGVIKYVNYAGTVILGGKKEEDILGREVLEFFDEDRKERVESRLKMLYEDKVDIPLTEGEMIRLDGGRIDVEFAAMPFDMDGKTAVQVVIRDVTLKKKQEQYIKFLALHDKLTGLPNRELLFERLGKAAERRRRDSLKNAILYIDLDNFKPINDTLGHDAGDDALREIAERLESSIRGSDTAARIGGDEFLILLEGVNSVSEVSVIADRVLNSINEPVVISEHNFHVGACIGISIFPEDTDDHYELVTKADRAMYYAKGTGKNRYVYYSEMPKQ